MSKILRWTGRVALLALLATLAYWYARYREYEHRWETGYCFEEDRYVPHDEMIDRLAETIVDAIDRELEQRRLYKENGNQRGPGYPATRILDIPLPRYEEGAHFQRVNPGGIEYAREKVMEEWEQSGKSLLQYQTFHEEFPMYLTVRHRTRLDLDEPDIESWVVASSCGWGMNRHKLHAPETGYLGLGSTDYIVRLYRIGGTPEESIPIPTAPTPPETPFP